jgi:hexokinase
MNVLVIDIGGTHVKVLITRQNAHREFDSGDNDNAFLGGFRLWQKLKARA